MSKKKTVIPDTTELKTLDDVLNNVDSKDIDPEATKDDEEIPDIPEDALDIAEDDSDVEFVEEYEEPLEENLHSSEYFKEIEIVKKEERVTSDIMSYYEFTEVIGIRETQISSGGTVYNEQSDLVNPFQLALKELFDKKSPLKIRRRVGDKIEIWHCHELAIPAEYRSDV